MSKYYACPCLLIEFDPSKSFCLQNANELGVDIKLDSICSKLTLLVLHFPKLRLLWSKSPHETLKLFHELKQNHEEVDVYKAMEVGRAESVEYLLETGEPLKDGVNENDLADDDDINEAGRDMLLSLPGVTISIARNIMKECDSLSDLIGMSRNDLRRLAGPVTGQKLFTFFHQNMGSL
jgi:DNA excision repair protein ERCC-4